VATLHLTALCLGQSEREHRCGQVAGVGIDEVAIEYLLLVALSLQSLGAAYRKAPDDARQLR